MAFEDIRAQTVTVIEALTPDTKRGGSDKFVEWKGMGLIQDMASGTMGDRRFEVFGSPGPYREDILVSDSEFEWEGRLDVVVAYKIDPENARTTRSRIDEDWDLLSFNLMKSANYFDDGSTVTQIVEPHADGPDVDQSDEAEVGMFMAIFPFRVNYRTTRT